MECTDLNVKLMNLVGYAVLMIGLFLLFMTPPEGKRRTQSLVVQIFSAIGSIMGLT